MPCMSLPVLPRDTRTLRTAFASISFCSTRSNIAVINPGCRSGSHIAALIAIPALDRSATAAWVSRLGVGVVETAPSRQNFCVPRSPARQQRPSIPTEAAALVNFPSEFPSATCPPLAPAAECARHRLGASASSGRRAAAPKGRHRALPAAPAKPGNFRPIPTRVGIRSPRPVRT